MTQEDEYTNNAQKLHYICPNGHMGSIRWTNFSSHQQGCKQCRDDALRMPYAQIRKEFEQAGFQLLSQEYEYQTARTLLRYVCGKCRKVRQISWNKFSQGRRCPCSTRYKGEERIAAILEDMGIRYERQKTFADCRDAKVLQFDFFIPDEELLIEYDGLGHYEPVPFNGASDKGASVSHERTVKHDAIKNAYCSKWGIALLRIPYWDYDKIPEVLKEHLN